VQARAGSLFCGVLDALAPPCLTAIVGRIASHERETSNFECCTAFAFRMHFGARYEDHRTPAIEGDFV